MNFSHKRRQFTHVRSDMFDGQMLSYKEISDKQYPAIKIVYFISTTYILQEVEPISARTGRLDGVGSLAQKINVK